MSLGRIGVRDVNRWKEYVVALSEDEALRLLTNASGQGRVIAGGTDLVVQFRDGRRRADVLVDITRIESLRKVTATENYLTVGAAVTHRELLEYLVVNDLFPGLRGALQTLGCPQIRNQGTVVGNIANMHGWADVGTAMLALGGELLILSRDGRRLVSLEDFYDRSSKQAKLDSTHEIAVEVRVKIPPRQQVSAYVRKGRRKGFSRPVMSCVVAITLNGDEIEDARIVVSPVLREPYRDRTLSPCTSCFPACRMCQPYRILAAERYLVGKRVKPQVLNHAAKQASEAIPTIRSSAVNGTSEYRRLMVEALVKQALSDATSPVLSGRV